MSAIEEGLDYFGEFTGKRILDVGSRDGSMAALFSELGGTVVAVDINPSFLGLIKNNPLCYDKDIQCVLIEDNCYDFDQSFDLIFTKSVCIVQDSLDDFVEKLMPLLKPKAHVMLIENGKGNKLIQWGRKLKNINAPWFDSSKYFDESKFNQLDAYFERKVAKTYGGLNPSSLYIGVKK